jgi:hypothetical protein
MIWLAIVIIAMELLGIGGFVLALSGGGGYATAQVAVCAALIVVPILFGVALRSELKAKKKS